MRFAAFLLAGLTSSLSTHASWTVAESAVSSVVGTWELTGIGVPDNLVTPERMILVLTPTGEFRTYVWEADELAPSETRGSYILRDGFLELTVPDLGAPEVFRVSGDAAAMELHAVEERRELPLHFERRPWTSP